jgi:hypothetical protein
LHLAAPAHPTIDVEGHHCRYEAARVAFLAAIWDPGHLERESMVEWAGGPFDPEASVVDWTGTRPSMDDDGVIPADEDDESFLILGLAMSNKKRR